MQQMPDSQQLAQIMRFAQSPEGQQLLSALRQSSSNELRSAMADAAAGNYTQAQKAISAFLETAEAKKMLSQMEGGK